MNKRIDKLRELLADDEAIYISSYPNIFYYSNFTSEDAALIISHDKAVLITDGRYTIQAKLQAPDFEIYDIKEELENIFKQFNVKYIGYEEDNITISEFEKLDKATNNKILIKKQSVISSLRKKKDYNEISKIKEAERLGDEAFSHILKFIKCGITEIEIALELEFFMRKNGASGLSFETIVASGVRSSMPHGVATDKIVQKGDLITLDFGCVFEGYCSDMTRTIAIGSVSDRQKEIYNVVLKAQTTAINSISCGCKCCDIDKIARDIISEAGFGENFCHSLGHSVGIEIHELPNLSKKSDTIIKNGHILTVEPGIYIENFGGVRIEDLVVINNGRLENLTHSPKELIIL